MALRNALPDSPAVHVPSSGADQPSWGRVAVIAAIGFAIGVAWPRLAGIRPGPSVPETAASAPAASASVATAAASAPSPVLAGPSASVAARVEAAPTPGNAPIVQQSAAASNVHASVSHGFVSSCRTTEGETLKGSDCGDLAGLDGVVLPRLRKLSECPAAAEANGKLHLTMHVDFARGSLSADVGRGKNVGNAEGLLACAKTALADATVGGIHHESARYNVAYVVTLSGGSGGSGSSAGDGTPAAEVAAPAAASATASRPSSSDGTAQVEWEVALVRDAPKTGKVLARLQRGTTLKIGPVSDGWYPVKYGDDFASEGWVYRGAIGR
jgi:hypothetical protein